MRTLPLALLTGLAVFIANLLLLHFYNQSIPLWACFLIGVVVGFVVPTKPNP